MEKTPEFHGSDLEKIASYYHMRKEDIICYSANVNPLGLSEKVRSQLAFVRPSEPTATPIPGISWLAMVLRN